MKLRFTQVALDELDDILTFIGAASPSTARRVQNRLKAMIELLPVHPRIGQTTSRRGMRRLVVSPYPYLIFYRVHETEVVIHGVRHASRDPPSNPT